MLAIGHESICFSVEVYRQVGSSWETHGNPIRDPNYYCSEDRRNLGPARGFYHGYYIALSGNGARLVIGSIAFTESYDPVTEYYSADLVVHTPMECNY